DLDALVAAIADGKTSWSPERAVKLAEGAGLTPSEAVFLWAGCPNGSDRSANFLDKELREKTLQLKAKQAEVARDSMNALPLAKRIRAIDAAGHAGVAALLDGAAVDALVAAWQAQFGVRVVVPEGLIADADRALWSPPLPKLALMAMGGAESVPELTTDGHWGFDSHGNVIPVSSAEPLVGQSKLDPEPQVFTFLQLETVLAYLPFVFAELPVGHPLRASSARSFELVRARLENPSLWIDAGSQYLSDQEAKAFDTVLDGLGGELLAGIEKPATVRRFRGAAVQRSGSRAELKLHPATLDAKARATVGKLAVPFTTWGGVQVWKALELAASPDYAAFVSRVHKTPVPEGKWEQNPQLSAPRTVAAVAAKHELSRDAAALYLQYLTLLWPTPKNVQLWNEWKPKQFETANAELLEHELILEAKRERAQRSSFLPGGWEALKSPSPPMESWKLPLYGTRSVEANPTPTLPRFLALAPFHLMFERAWQRCEAGDVPRYEEVKR
ncbi:MAG TPA: hypothetical protein VK427_20715, partial [Kofleriaceae bacterium]|nr:hypothetical protein [Kofleriaceae bacterium]